MTKADALKITNPETLPWDEPCMVFTPGRYYLGMFFMNLPKVQGNEGGDVTFQIWRYNATPLEWVTTLRTRFYVGKDVWNGKDRKQWFVYQTHGDELHVEHTILSAISNFSGDVGLRTLTAPEELERLYFRGECDKAVQILTEAAKTTHWLHMRVEKQR